MTDATLVAPEVAASLACHAAIKVHRPMSSQEISQLTADLLQSSNPFACPHGRPIIVDDIHEEPRWAGSVTTAPSSSASSSTATAPSGHPNSLP